MEKLFVMILEDEYWARKSLIRLCGSLPGVDVVGEFEDAGQAVAFVHEKHIDAAIIDIMLPDSSGLEVGKILKAEFPELKLIFTSAVDAYETQIQECGGSAFLHKPVKMEDLQYALGRANQA